MKKITAVLLSVVMMLSVMTMTAFAADAEDCIRLSTTVDHDSDQLYVKVRAKKDTTNGRITIKYNTRHLAYNTFSTDDASNYIFGTMDKAGEITIIYAVKDQAVAAMQVLFTIVFDVKSGDKTTLRTVLEEFNNNEDLDAEYPSLSVKLTESDDETPEPDPEPTIPILPIPDPGADTPSDTEDKVEDSDENKAEDKEEEKKEPSVEMKNLTDVSEGQWFYEAVEHVVEQGYFKGVTDNSFAPQEKMTRAMFVTVLGRIAGVEETSDGNSDFADVKNGQWFSGFVAWASEAGIVQGADGKFDPNGNITREQMAVFLYRYAQYAGLDLTVDNDAVDKFSDFDNVSGWAKEAMLWAVSNGIINGTDLGLEPTATATRAQVAQIVLNFEALIAP